MQQHSNEWHQWRAGGIGASEIAAVLGISPWMTAYELWRLKTGRAQPQHETPAMARGTKLEAPARFDYTATTGQDVTTDNTTLAMDGHPHIRASLDGWTAWEGQTAVWECKCPGMAQYDAMREAVPEHYRAQLQQQMLCAGVDVAVFWVWHPQAGGYYHIEHKDEVLQRRILEEAGRFWQAVQDDRWPEDELDQLADALAEAKAAEQDAAERKRRIEQQIIEEMGRRNARKLESSRWRLAVVQRTVVDRERCASDPQWAEIDAQRKQLVKAARAIEDKYRKPAAPSLRLTARSE